MVFLEPIYNRFSRRLDRLELIFKGWVDHASGNVTEVDMMFLEGLISTLWQHWSLFCRRVVYASAVGCTTRNGGVIVGCITPPTWERFSYIVWRAHSGGSVKPLLVNTDLKKEPTWGDVQKVQNIIKMLSPQNVQHLATCFGAISRGPVHVQIVRNAAAHRNYQTFGNVLNLRTYYNATPIRHPAETVTWSEPTSNDYAFTAWLADMRIVADLITS